MCKPVLDTCCCILTNASYIPDIEADFIGVDKGALICLKRGIKMHMMIGDFDSISSEEKRDLINRNEQMHMLSCHKDVSDSEAAVLWAKQQGYQRIVLFTDMSGRFDHCYVNYRLVEKYGCELIDHQNRIFLIEEGTKIIEKLNYQYVSFFACDEAIVSLDGFAYPLHDYVLKSTDVLCLSNEILKEKGIVTTTGKLWCVQSNDLRKKAVKSQ